MPKKAALTVAMALYLGFSTTAAEAKNTTRTFVVTAKNFTDLTHPGSSIPIASVTGAFTVHYPGGVVPDTTEGVIQRGISMQYDGPLVYDVNTYGVLAIGGQKFGSGSLPWNANDFALIFGNAFNSDPIYGAFYYSHTSSADLYAAQDVSLKRFDGIPTVADIVKKVYVTSEGPIIRASFKPELGLTLDEAARVLGFDHFNWQQTLTSSDPGTLPWLTAKTGHYPPFYDPVPNGYDYNPGLQAYPYYYDASNSYSIDGYNLRAHISPSGQTLGFADMVDVPCTPGFRLIDACNTYFTTTLVGVSADGSVARELFTFYWRSDFNSEVNKGGAALLNNPGGLAPPGVGGVTLLSQQLLVGSVPEPSTWVMLILGFGCLGSLIRTQRATMALSVTIRGLAAGK